MKLKDILVYTVIIGFISCLTLPSALALQKKKQEKETPESVIIIPDKVKNVLNEGLKTKQARLDIPFSITWNI